MKKYSELSEEQKEKIRAYNREWQRKKRLADPLGYRIENRKRCAKYREAHREEVREYVRNYMREYRKNPIAKAKEVEYRNRPEVKLHTKAYKKKYNARPEVKLRMKAYNARPEVKRYKAAYKKGYRAGQKHERELIRKVLLKCTKNN